MSEEKRGYRCEVCILCGRCFEESIDLLGQSTRTPSPFAVLKRSDGNDELDASTGATPGVSSACSEYGFDDISTVLKQRGIKPPGQS